MCYPPRPYPHPVYVVYPRVNSLATPAMVIGVVSLFLWFLSPVAIIMGHASIDQINNRGEEGKGQAIAGAFLGWLVFTPFMVFVAFFIAAAASS